jgi:hypothetical protein
MVFPAIQRRHLRLLVVAFLLSSLPFPAWAQSPNLFKPRSFKSLARTQPASTDPWVIWRNTLEIDPTVIEAFIPEPGETLTFNIAEWMAFEAILEDVEFFEGGAYCWSGTIEGYGDAQVTVGVKDDVIVAHIEVPTVGEFEFRYLGEGVVEIRQLDPSQFQPCALGPEHAVPTVFGEAERDTPEAPTAGDAASIDLMIVYTPNARAVAGGTTAMEAAINTAVFDANTAFSNSGINAQFNLVHTAEIAYVESGDISTDLSRLRGSGDGFMDSVHVLRSLYGADIVSLVPQHGGYSGVGYVMQFLSPGFGGSAFNVVNFSLFSNQTLAHEIGHNLGCTHDLPNANVDGLYPYSYGWRWGADAYRSIMSYPPGSRLKFFSSPLVQDHGEATGVADAADNALTINNSAATAAAWRAELGEGDAALENISTRGKALTGDGVMIAGFIIEGDESKPVLIRARGPSLAGAGVPGVLSNPKLAIFSGATPIGSNDDWNSGGQGPAIEATGFAPPNSLEAAVLLTLEPGAYTAIMDGVGGATGVGIVEVIDVDEGDASLLTNISTRGEILTGDEVMIGGFVIAGDGPRTVVIRARGPSLSGAGVAGAMANPTMSVFFGGTQIGGNDDWQSDGHMGDIQSAGLAPPDALESATIATLPPGAYTVIVQGVGGGTGIGIVEVFDITD